MAGAFITRQAFIAGIVRVTLKKLFLAHYSGDAAELRELAVELRLHGIVPWMDKDGGFSVADNSEMEARRAIRENCFGLLLYATEHVFDRPFIRDVEMDEARKIKASDPSFDLFAVPRSISFDVLRERSLRSFQVDLSAFHTIPITDNGNLETHWETVASEIVARRLQRAVAERSGRSLSLQYSTRELMPHQPDDVLCIDATSQFQDNIANAVGWRRLIRALRNLKRQISKIYGRPRLIVHGSKHLAAAFIFGRVFAPFDLDIWQTKDQIWRTDLLEAADITPLNVSYEEGRPGSRKLFLEIASGYKNVEDGVDAYLANQRKSMPFRLQLRPPPNSRLKVDNALCGAMVKQTYSELEHVMKTHHTSGIHIFAAAPQSFMMMLGREFKGMPAVRLYEWDGVRYVLCCAVPAGVL